jgi:cardiolipin synthase
MSLFLSILQWFLIAVFGLILLIFLGLYFRGAFRQRVTYNVRHVPDPGESRFPLAIAGVSNSFITTGKVTDFWVDIDTIQQRRYEAIMSATQSIHFETFFMTPGKRADQFAGAIADKAAAGVEVKLMVDSYGSGSLPKRYWQGLEAAGVEICRFNPFNLRAPANFAGRTHRKLLIIDGKYALVGGAGISDAWDGLAEIGDQQPWLDTEVRLEGQVVTILEAVFMQHWTYSGGVANLSREIVEPEKEFDQTMLVTPGTNPTYRFSPIKSLFNNCLLSAKKRIWLSSPYFLPDSTSRKILINAKKRGLDVRILTTSSRSDKKWVSRASVERSGDLLKGGVEIYGYQPSMMHAKLLLIDDAWVVSGSANFDSRSLYHNDELNYSTGERFVVEKVKQIFEDGFAQAKQYDLDEWRDRDFWKYRVMGNLVSFFQWQL